MHFHPTRALICSLMFASVLVSSPPVQAQKNASTLEERMSATQFKAYGLDKLTPDELKGLNEWLQGSSPLESPGNNARNPKYGFAASDADRTEVQANIVGTFSGWSGRTVFRLDNGQEWQQSESGTFQGPILENPAVTIKPKLMGSWLLVIDRCDGCRIGVKRIK
jgi:hypothetical protein